MKGTDWRRKLSGPTAFVHHHQPAMEDPVDPTVAPHLAGVLRQMGRMLQGIVGKELSKPALDELSGSLHPLGETLVRAVSLSMMRRPELFPDLPFTGEQMQERQREALGWQALRQVFLGAAEACHENYVRQQATVNKQALQAVHDVIETAQKPWRFPHLDVGARGICMLVPLSIAERLRRYSKRKT